MLAKTLIVSVLFWLLAQSAMATEPSRDRRNELIHRLRHDCGSCHGLTLKGGLGPALLPSNLASQEDGLLIDIILNGIPGTPMPPWKFELSEAEARWLIGQLKKGL